MSDVFWSERSVGHWLIHQGKNFMRRLNVKALVGVNHFHGHKVYPIHHDMDVIIFRIMNNYVYANLLILYNFY